MITQKALMATSVTSEPEYVTFTPSSGVVKVSAVRTFWNGTIEYSTDGENWNVFTGSEVSGDVLYFRGTGNTYCGNTNTASPAKVWSITTSTSGTVACEGVLDTLLDYQSVMRGIAPTRADACFACLFMQNRTLTSSPILPSSLSDYCFSYMFSECAALVEAPDLPAITLEPCCYQYMFMACTSMTTPPSLPATTLADSCYSNMFRGCASVTKIPTIKSLVMNDNCLAYMFRGCTSLKVSTTQTSECPNAYRIPKTGTGDGSASRWNNNTFYQTSGTFTGSPVINTTYYTNLPVLD